MRSETSPWRSNADQGASSRPPRMGPPNQDQLRASESPRLHPDSRRATPVERLVDLAERILRIIMQRFEKRLASEGRGWAMCNEGQTPRLELARHDLYDFESSGDVGHALRWDTFVHPIAHSLARHSEHASELSLVQSELSPNDREWLFIQPQRRHCAPNELSEVGSDQLRSDSTRGCDRSKLGAHLSPTSSNRRGDAPSESERSHPSTHGRRHAAVQERLAVPALAKLSTRIDLREHLVREHSDVASKRFRCLKRATQRWKRHFLEGHDHLRVQLFYCLDKLLGARGMADLHGIDCSRAQAERNQTRKYGRNLPDDAARGVRSSAPPYGCRKCHPVRSKQGLLIISCTNKNAGNREEQRGKWLRSGCLLPW